MKRTEKPVVVNEDELAMQMEAEEEQEREQHKEMQVTNLGFGAL